MKSGPSLWSNEEWKAQKWWRPANIKRRGVLDVKWTKSKTPIEEMLKNKANWRKCFNKPEIAYRETEEKTEWKIQE